MDGDVNNYSAAQSCKNNSDANSMTTKSTISTFSTMASVHKTLHDDGNDAMDTSFVPPLEEQIHNLQKRGISIQQKLRANQQLPEQRFETQQLEKQQHDVQLVPKSWQVQNTKARKMQIAKPLRNKVSNKRKKYALAKGADSLSDVSDLAHSPSRSNKFALLSDLEFITTNTVVSNKIVNADAVNTDAISNAPTNTNTSVNANAASQPKHVSNDGVATQFKSTRRFCPPIILFNIDISKLVNQFKTKFPETEIKIVNVSKNKSKLYVKELHAYNTIMQTLKEQNISSHSFTPPENKQLSLIIRGLHCHTLPEEIKAELDLLIPGIISDVKMFLTPYMKSNKVISDLFLVTLLPGKTYNDVINIKFLLCQKVIWEKPHATAKELQCKRCQRWGHIAKNCNHQFQCVKCDKSHQPGLCVLTKNDNSQAYCVNCKQWGHPANFKGCEVYKTLLANKMAKARSASNIKAKTPSSSFVSPNKSYASLLRQNNSNLPPSSKNSKLISDFITIAREILNADPLPLEVRLQNFINNFKTLSPADRKAECIKLLKEIESADD